MQDERARALREAISQCITNHPECLFPEFSDIKPEDFDRLCIRTPERWVSVDSLPRDAQGRVKVGGDVVAIWKYAMTIVHHMGVLRS